MAARKFGPDRDDGDCMAQIQELQEQLNRMQEVDRRRREQCGSWPLQGTSLMTSWRSTWKPNSLHTMASDPPAMNHPSDVLTIRRFVRLAWIVTPLCCACAREMKCTFEQVHEGEQSLQPSHHGHYALRLRSPNPSWSAIFSTKSPRRPRIAPTQPALVPPLRRQGRGLIHIFDLFAMLQ
jgi:hypothetical protein